jgi:hypothetical protein
MIWTQNYDPLHSPALSTLVAAEGADAAGKDALIAGAAPDALAGGGGGNVPDPNRFGDALGEDGSVNGAASAA